MCFSKITTKRLGPSKSTHTGPTGTDPRAQILNFNPALLFDIKTSLSIDIFSIFLSVTNQLKNVSQ